MNRFLKRQRWFQWKPPKDQIFFLNVVSFQIRCCIKHEYLREFETMCENYLSIWITGPDGLVMINEGKKISRHSNDTAELCPPVASLIPQGGQKWILRFFNVYSALKKYNVTKLYTRFFHDKVSFWYLIHCLNNIIIFKKRSRFRRYFLAIFTLKKIMLTLWCHWHREHFYDTMQAVRAVFYHDLW